MEAAKSGFIGIIRRPNAKSTLLNNAGEKIMPSYLLSDEANDEK